MYIDDQLNIVQNENTLTNEVIDSDDKLEKSNPKSGRPNGKNSTWQSGKTRIPKKLNHEIHTICNQNRTRAADNEKKVSARTAEIRKTNVLNFFSDLMYLGYRLESVHNLKQKHLKAVFMLLEENQQLPSVIQNKISCMRIFCEWIGKSGMVIESYKYVKDPSSVRRSMVADDDKSWTSNGVDLQKIMDDIRAIDNGKEERVAVWLEQCLAFGLRIRESVMLRPGVSDQGEALYIIDGPKNGRARFVPIKNDMQRAVLEKAKIIADKKTGHLGKRGKSVEQNIQHFYYVLRKVGITLADKGVSAHGLRHEFAHDEHKLLTGVAAPIRGGDISEVPPYEYHNKSIILMEQLGHSRVSIGASYYGSRRRRTKKCIGSDSSSNS